jgi:osmoprotectant transport system substrate-binding protein
MGSRVNQLLRNGLLAVAVTLVVCACGSSSPTGTSSVASTTASGSTPRGGPGTGKPTVTIGTKNFTEELILGQLYAQALRAKGFSVTLKNDIGASEVVHRQLAAGQIDGYPEYTGTILSVLAHDSRRPPNADVAYLRAAAFERRHGDVLLAMAPATDTDVVIAKPAFAALNHLNTLADLARLGSGATLAGPPEFKTRFNGLIGLNQVYGVRHIGFLPVQIGDQYQAIDSGRAQLATAFTTDGQLSQGTFTLLADPQNIFGFQNVAFVIRGDTLAREGPAFARTINAVSAKLSTQALRVMNAAVVLDQQSAVAVARRFLGANGLA